MQHSAESIAHLHFDGMNVKLPTRLVHIESLPRICVWQHACMPGIIIGKIPILPSDPCSSAKNSEKTLLNPAFSQSFRYRLGLAKFQNLPYVDAVSIFNMVSLYHCGDGRIIFPGNFT